MKKFYTIFILFICISIVSNKSIKPLKFNKYFINNWKGDGWEKLCPFLGVDIPKISFPHANKSSEREKDNAHPLSSRSIRKRLRHLVKVLKSRFT